MEWNVSDAHMFEQWGLVELRWVLSVFLHHNTVGGIQPRLLFYGLWKASARSLCRSRGGGHEVHLATYIEVVQPTLCLWWRSEAGGASAVGENI
jgi:hypothetical protein